MNPLKSVLFWAVVTLIFYIYLLVFHFFNTRLHPKVWKDVYDVIHSLLSGSVISFLFYYLLVFRSNKEKTDLYKKVFENEYNAIKYDILFNVVASSILGGRHDLRKYLSSGNTKKLMNPNLFKEEFDNGREADEGFYAFQNQMSYNTAEFRNIIHSLGLMQNKIQQFMYKFEFDSDIDYIYFHRLDNLLGSIRRNGHGYEESKQLCSFVYQMFSGWDPLNGYSGTDKTIEAFSRL